MEKYLFLKKPISMNMRENNLFKIITVKENSYIIAGKAPRFSDKNMAFYNLPFEKIDDKWIDLDEFLSKCTIVGKKFYRTKELNSKGEATHAFMKISTFLPKVIMLAICDDGFIYYDQSCKCIYILNSNYISDGNIQYIDSDHIDLPFELSKQGIKKELTSSLDKNIQNSLFESLELN